MNPIKAWLGKARAYKAVFGVDDASRTEAQRIVLADLAKLCNSQRPSVRIANNAVDVNATMIGEGRREVFLRIIGQCDITEAEIYNYIKQIEGK